ncbi:MAG: hypothetical protein KC475_12190, partial [Cyanobacteria bacterium HKST-UBA03]|nr:hypothetical protein [Cyanobacteria bacterium HKST-UBA03]
ALINKKGDVTANGGQGGGYVLVSATDGKARVKGSVETTGRFVIQEITTAVEDNNNDNGNNGNGQNKTGHDDNRNGDKVTGQDKKNDD